MTDLNYWYKKAIEASEQTGWLPEVIFTQWQVETAHFTSDNFKKNNNLAGQTWYERSKYPKGTARPKKEGGYYIKYPDAVAGYVDFINNSNRYSKVKTKKTAEAQFKEIARAGWATDKNYADTLIAVHNANMRKGNYSTANANNVTSVTKNDSSSVRKEIKYTSIVDYLNSAGINSSFNNRKKLAAKHGIINYTGTASQNIELLKRLRK